MEKVEEVKPPSPIRPKMEAKEVTYDTCVRLFLWCNSRMIQLICQATSKAYHFDSRAWPICDVELWLGDCAQCKHGLEAATAGCGVVG